MSELRVFWSFVVKTFAFSWIVWIPVIVLELDTVEHTAGMLIFLLGGFGPSLFGFYELFIKADRAGRDEFWSRLLSLGRIGLMWLLITLLFYPGVFALSVAIDTVFISDSLPEADKLRSMIEGGALVFLFNTIYILLLGPLAEEIGWRGYLLDRTQAVLSPLKSTLLVGTVWWAWHLPLFFMPSTLHGSQGLLSFFSFGYFITVMGYSFLFTWLFNKTNRSILIPILAHFVINFTLGTLPPFSGMIFVISSILLMVISIILYWRDRTLGKRKHVGV
ncbi:MAG: CPBP family intramembrane glutamic endopeptidase [Candidatus Dojkabacteria bacterium]